MNRKNTLFLISSAENSDGYIEFVNLGTIVSADVFDVYLKLGQWDGYKYWFTFDTHENAVKALDILVDQMDQGKANTPKKSIKLNELDGVRGTDGIMGSSYNSTVPWIT